jgi:hypothetical protein
MIYMTEIAHYKMCHLRITITLRVRSLYRLLRNEETDAGERINSIRKGDKIEMDGLVDRTLSRNTLSTGIRNLGIDNILGTLDL